MGSWGYKAHESDTGLDMMDKLMAYAKDRGGSISLDVAMNLFRKENHMASPGFSIEDPGDYGGYDVYLLYEHEFTVMALAEALIEQSQKGIYSKYGHSNDQIKISYTAENLEFLKREFDRFLNGGSDETVIGRGWVEPEKWLKQTRETLEQLKALKPSIMENLQPETQPMITAYLDNAVSDKATEIAFPTTKEKLQTALIETDTYDEHYKCEIVGTSIASPYLQRRLENIENISIDELNFLAHKLQKLLQGPKEQSQIFEAVIESGKHCGSVLDILNVLENLSCFYLEPAYSSEALGEHRLSVMRDDVAEFMNQLENNTHEQAQALIEYIGHLEDHVDAVGFGVYIKEEEDGYFSDQGYLTETQENFKEVYRSADDIPTEHKVFAVPERILRKAVDVDLVSLIYQINAMANDSVPEHDYNINKLIDKSSTDYLLLVSQQRIHLAEIEAAYEKGTHSYEIWMNTSPEPDAKAYAIHVLEGTDGLVGDVVELHFRAQLKDMEQNCVPSKMINENDTRDMAPIELDYVWQQNEELIFQSGYALERIKNDMRENHKSKGQVVDADVFLIDINKRFMAEAANQQPDMLRIARSAAAEMTAQGSEVYRLFPTGAEKLLPTDAVRHKGLQYEEFREFAVKKADIGAVAKWAERQMDNILRQLNAPEKTNKNDHDRS